MPLIIIFLLAVGPTTAGSEAVHGRFFLEGDGQVALANKKTGQQATIRYRLPDGTYPPQGIAQIDRVFGVPAGSGESISLRFVSLLDYLQDHYTSSPLVGEGRGEGAKGQTHGAAPTIQIVSGYRSPTYNENLRKKGKLAAKTSLHIEGMAADIEMPGVPAEKLWRFVRDLNCCGAGYYHGKGIHVDTGPVRFWDETSTKVGTDISGHNKLIMVQTDKDIYRPGEIMLVSLSRITDYPIGIILAPLPGTTAVTPTLTLPPQGGGDKSCRLLAKRSDAKDIPWPLPADTSRNKKTRLTLQFCQKPFPEMPDQIESNEFVIRH